MSEPLVGHSDSHTPQVQTSHHEPNFRAYIYVFLALCVLTGVSFVVYEIMGQGQSSMLVILGVSVVKSTLVAVIFMHLRTDWPKVYCIIIPVSVMGVMMIIVLLPDIVLSWHHYFYK